MPFVVPLILVGGALTAWVSNLGDRAAQSLPWATNPADQARDGQPNLPWYVPVAVVGVGALLLYKYGAKKLKV